MTVDPTILLQGLGSTLDLIDKLWDPVGRLIRRLPDSTKRSEPSIVAKTEQDSLGQPVIVIRERGVEFATITAADLKSLDNNQRKLIKALEDDMQDAFDLWTTLYPQREASTDALVNAKVQKQLDRLAQRICQNLDRIFNVLLAMNKVLADHYTEFRSICSNFSSTPK